MKISQTTIFRQTTAIARNNDPATTQVVQTALQKQEPKKPKGSKYTPAAVGCLVVLAVVKLAERIVDGPTLRKPHK